MKEFEIKVKPKISNNPKKYLTRKDIGNCGIKTSYKKKIRLNKIKLRNKEAYLKYSIDSDGYSRRNKEIKEKNKMKVVKKPWGREIWFAQQKRKYLGKILIINKGERGSMHFHRRKDETFYVAEGTLTLLFSKNSPIGKKVLRKGEAIHIPAKTRHSLQARNKRVVLFEVSTYHPKDSVKVIDYYE